MSMTVSSMTNSAIDYSNLLNSANSSDNSGNTLLADYAAIKNGSLKKLYKAYYSETESDEEKTSKSAAYSNVKGNASSLKSSLNKLQSNKLYDGNSTDELYKAVSDFVSDYNKTFTSSASESADATNNMALRLASVTKTYSNQLDKIGISMDEDGKLSVDEDSFKEAVSSSSGLAAAKDLFGTSYGYSNIINSKTSIIESISSNRIKSGGTKGYGSAYGSGGDSSSVLDSLIDVDA